MLRVLGLYRFSNESRRRQVKSKILFAKNKFEGEFVETIFENQNRTSRRGSTNSTSSSAKIIFEYQSITCRKANKYAKIKKIRVQHVKEQIDMYKVYMNIIVEECPETYIIDQIFNQRFKKYLNYNWIQQFVVKNVRSQIFKRVKDQLGYIIHSYRFHPTTCTTIEYVDLVWEEFANFYTLMYSFIHLFGHALTQFPDLLHFLDSQVVYKKTKGIPLIGPKLTSPNSWRLGPRISQP